MSDDTETPSIAQFLGTKANEVEDRELRETFKQIASEVYELERQLEETTTIRRMSDALSKNFAELLEKALEAIPSCTLHKLEYAWFIHLDDTSTENGTTADRSFLITITVGGSSLRFRSGENRTELDLNELDNFILKGHASKMQDRIHEALRSVNNDVVLS